MLISKLTRHWAWSTGTPDQTLADLHAFASSLAQTALTSQLFELATGPFVGKQVTLERSSAKIADFPPPSMVPTLNVSLRENYGHV